jgi:hypothetical protein
MQEDRSLFPRFRQLTAIGIAGIAWLSYAELRAVWTQDPPSEVFFSPSGRIMAALYGLLLLAALAVLIAGLWRPHAMQYLAAGAPRLAWPLSILSLGLIAWFCLFSPLQVQLAGPWAPFLIAAGLSRLIAWWFKPGEDRPFGWEELALALAFFLFPRMVQEARIIYPSPVLSRTAILALGASVLFLIGLLFAGLGASLRRWLLAARLRLGPSRPWLIVLLLLAPVIYRYLLGAGGYILYPNIRFAVWLIALALVAYLLCSVPDRIVSLKAIAESAGWFVLVLALNQLLLLVVSDPFSLTWSEGNRFYDYSLVFGQDLYDYSGRIINPYNSPGRYFLWGVLFLWRGLPIWAHRLWNVGLLALPALPAAWLLTRKIEKTYRTVVFLWMATFFIVIAPLHPPFMLVLMTVTAFAFHPSPVVRGASLVAASLYASLSRWTWVVAPGAWGALIDLFLYYPNRKGNWFQRLLPTLGMAILGAAPGLLVQAGYLSRFSSGDTLTASQPLLWYRLLPNPTLGPGVMFLMLFTTGPLVAVLIYQAAAGRWKLDLFQSLALWGALAVFLLAGLVISTKIGGGGDLHNLDMYIGTLMLGTMLLLSARPGQPAGGASRDALVSQPAWVWALLLLLAVQPVFPFTPFSANAGYNKWLDLPTPMESRAVLDRIRMEVDSASQRGEVLFMDQRQLLTFGYIPRVPFIPEYEKKYMMDQAMGDNAGYFLPYYRDLQSRRFALIVTEPLRAGLKEEGVFSEENNAWVVWVSAPTLCFYEPIMTDKTVGVQLLVPRQEPRNCEKYFQQAVP